MRPLRFLLLLTAFVVVPIILTCWSLFRAEDGAPSSLEAEYATRSNRLTTWLSFSTPSSLFPPSAIISLKSDNSTFFLARPAAFGPGLPSHGLAGKLWVGRGFGDDALLREEDVRIAGWELGCSDVPGWGEEDLRRYQQGKNKNTASPKKAEEQKPNTPVKQNGQTGSADAKQPAIGKSDEDDGTDDHLHRPLPDSNPATPVQPGEPANAAPLNNDRPPTHADIESLQESADIAGKIVMLARGGCGFLEKVKWAQRRGGVAVIVGDNQKNNQLTVMYAKGDTSNVTIPAIFTSYTSAHILSSLVPLELFDETNTNGAQGGKQVKDSKPVVQKGKSPKVDDGPVFTSTDKSVPTKSATSQDESKEQKGWLKNALSAVGVGGDSPTSHAEDSRRPPSSGNIDWVLVEDWEEDDMESSRGKVGNQAVVKIGPSSCTSVSSKATKSAAAGDNFVIGVQDWRDTDLLAPAPSQPVDEKAVKGKAGKAKTSETTGTFSGNPAAETALKGGSITPGSGEYDHSKMPAQQHQDSTGAALTNTNNNSPSGRGGLLSWLSIFGSSSSTSQSKVGSGSGQKSTKSKGVEKVKGGESEPGKDGELPGLWVTLTPTTVSTSPFLDTLLVLVVSPLVTLTFVYGLLLLRSRIRRRRWRAPKSVVDRLPVRTYHTMNTASSTTSSQVNSPTTSPTSLPLLSTSRPDLCRRPRPRSQTTPALIPTSSSDEQNSSSSPSRSPPREKLVRKSSRPKKYTGRQVECVVCLEEYVDGESQVMSLPCGHEFHAECITPWLVTRRRTCPICKGDVVRNLARSDRGGNVEPSARRDESTSDDVQERVVETTNDEPTAAIPIPAYEAGESLGSNELDIERGPDTDLLLTESTRGQDGQNESQAQGQGSSSAWRNVIGSSISRLSGDTVWKQTPTPTSRSR